MMITSLFIGGLGMQEVLQKKSKRMAADMDRQSFWDQLAAIVKGLFVALPMWLLYEVSILIVKKTKKKG